MHPGVLEMMWINVGKNDRQINMMSACRGDDCAAAQRSRSGSTHGLETSICHILGMLC